MNTGYEDMFAPEYYIGTEAIVIDTSNTAVSDHFKIYLHVITYFLFSLLFFLPS